MADEDVILQHRNAPLNMARFYAMSLEPSLFGEIAVLRRWGRIGTKGRHRLDLHASLTQARAAMASIETAKRRRGYVRVDTGFRLVRKRQYEPRDTILVEAERERG